MQSDKFAVTLRKMRGLGGELTVTSHLSRTHKFTGDKLWLGRRRDGGKFIAQLNWSNYELRHSKSRGCVRLGQGKEKLYVTTRLSRRWLLLGMLSLLVSDCMHCLVTENEAMDIHYDVY